MDGGGLVWRHGSVDDGWYAQVWWLQEAEHLLVYSVCPYLVPVERHAAVADVVRVANTRLVHAVLELDDPGGDLRCRTSVAVDGAHLTEDLVARAIDGSLATMAAYLPSIE